VYNQAVSDPEKLNQYEPFSPEVSQWRLLDVKFVSLAVVSVFGLFQYPGQYFNILVPLFVGR
jgi:hypothetical protein